VEVTEPVVVPDDDEEGPVVETGAGLIVVGDGVPVACPVLPPDGRVKTDVTVWTAGWTARVT